MARAKICGLRTPADVQACLEGGAAFVGFVDFPKSPRHIEPHEARPLLDLAAGKTGRVLLCVDPQDDRLDQWAALDSGIDAIQVQGQETAERLAAIKARYGWHVIKACGVSSSAEVLECQKTYGLSADMLLFEAKPPKDSDRPGGNATKLDWSILADVRLESPWMLAGGLDANNVGEAIQVSKAPLVDVSSGVERTKGVKDATKIAEFLAAVEAAG